MPVVQDFIPTTTCTVHAVLTGGYRVANQVPIL